MDTWKSALIDFECALSMFNNATTKENIDLAIRTLNNTHEKMQILRDFTVINGPLESPFLQLNEKNESVIKRVIRKVYEKLISLRGF